MNIQNRTIYCSDNIHVLRGINSETVDMIYLDPPFNKKKSFTAPIGSAAEGASFKDVFTVNDIDSAWTNEIGEDYPELLDYIGSLEKFADVSDMAYITYMGIRLIHCKRILKETGSIFYHCDDTMQHYIKIMMDIIFGRSNFQNELNWRRATNHSDGKRFGRITDAILWFTKSDKYKFNNVYIPRDDVAGYFPYTEPGTNRRYRRNVITGPGKQNSLIINGQKMMSHPGRMYWSQSKFDEAMANGRIDITDKNTPYHKMYMDEDKGIQAQDLWIDIPTKAMKKAEKKGYPTQKPLELLRRLIKATTDEGDIILDPFCGCATAPVAAEELNRGWIGVDVSPKAYELIRDRLKEDVSGMIEGQTDLFKNETHVFLKMEAPERTDIDVIEAENEPRKKSRYVPNVVKEFVYNRDGGACVSCGSSENIAYDHIIPFSKGGSNTIENLQILCQSCNSQKGNRSHS